MSSSHARAQAQEPTDPFSYPNANDWPSQSSGFNGWTTNPYTNSGPESARHSNSRHHYTPETPGPLMNTGPLGMTRLPANEQLSPEMRNIVRNASASLLEKCKNEAYMSILQELEALRKSYEAKDIELDSLRCANAHLQQAIQLSSRLVPMQQALPSRTLSLNSQRKPLPEHDINLLVPANKDKLKMIRFRDLKAWTNYIKAKEASNSSVHALGFIQSADGEYYEKEDRSKLVESFKRIMKELHYGGWLPDNTTWSYVDAEAKSCAYAILIEEHPALGLCEDGIWKAKTLCTYQFPFWTRDTQGKLSRWNDPHPSSSKSKKRSRSPGEPKSKRKKKQRAASSDVEVIDVDAQAEPSQRCSVIPPTPALTDLNDFDFPDATDSSTSVHKGPLVTDSHLTSASATSAPSPPSELSPQALTQVPAPLPPAPVSSSTPSKLPPRASIQAALTPPASASAQKVTAPSDSSPPSSSARIPAPSLLASLPASLPVATSAETQASVPSPPTSSSAQTEAPVPSPPSESPPSLTQVPAPSAPASSSTQAHQVLPNPLSGVVVPSITIPQITTAGPSCGSQQLSDADSSRPSAFPPSVARKPKPKPKKSKKASTDILVPSDKVTARNLYAKDYKAKFPNATTAEFLEHYAALPASVKAKWARTAKKTRDEGESDNDGENDGDAE